MRENKKKLKFKKIKIASMSSLKGGIITNTCQSDQLPHCPQVPASAPGNPCSDACLNASGLRPHNDSAGQDECILDNNCLQP